MLWVMALWVLRGHLSAYQSKATGKIKTQLKALDISVQALAAPSRSWLRRPSCGRVEPRSDGAQAVPRWAGPRTTSASERTAQSRVR